MNWLKALHDANTIEELLAIVNDYLLQQPDEFWSWIPAESRPRLVAAEDEVHHWHHKLAEELQGGASHNIRMQDLCVFFVRASARALEIRRGAGKASSNDRDFACPANRAAVKRAR